MSASKPSADIVLIGEALVDVFPDGDVIGGAPFNVARNLAALGATPVMITCVGNDERGQRIASEFERFGVPATGLQRHEHLPTGTVRVSFAEGSHRFEILANQAWDAIDADAAVAATVAASPKIVYFGTLAQRDPRSREAIYKTLAATRALRFLDLNLRSGPDNRELAQHSLSAANIVKVNEDELKALLQWFVQSEQIASLWGDALYLAAIAELIRKFDLQQLIVTRGEAGYAAFDEKGSLAASGVAPAVSVVDTVGAGDAFSSVVLLGHIHEWPPGKTLERANAFAAAVCGLRGAVTSDSTFYQDWRERLGLSRAPSVRLH